MTSSTSSTVWPSNEMRLSCGACADDVGRTEPVDRREAVLVDGLLRAEPEGAALLELIVLAAGEGRSDRRASYEPADGGGGIFLDELGETDESALG